MTKKKQTLPGDFLPKDVKVDPNYKFGAPVEKSKTPIQLAFICDMPRDHFLYWNDGLKAALNYLAAVYDWEISIFNIQSMRNAQIEDKYDFVLFWGSLSKPQHASKKFRKQGLCFAGGVTYHPSMKNFDIIFAESEKDYQEFKELGVKVVKAFGTNTDLFREIPEQTKVWDYIFPAAYAKWKRHDLFVEHIKKKKAKALVVGHMQPDDWEKECYEVCLKSGITVLPWVSADALVWLYNASKKVLVTSDSTGGSQRVVLEAIMCGLEVEMDTNSPKLLELKGLTKKDVVKKWSHAAYAEALKKGIESIVNEK